MFVTDIIRDFPAFLFFICALKMTNLLSDQPAQEQPAQPRESGHSRQQWGGDRILVRNWHCIFMLL